MKQARAGIEEALDWSERSEERWYLAELLRINGELFRLEGSVAAVQTAEDHYLQALEWARRQQALSWELCAATSLALQLPFPFEVSAASGGLVSSPP